MARIDANEWSIEVRFGAIPDRLQRDTPNRTSALRLQRVFLCVPAISVKHLSSLRQIRARISK